MYQVFTLRPLFILLAGLLTVSLCAQRQALNWHFGDSVSISFANDNPVLAPPSSITAFEGSIAHSDDAGNLLFYSNGGGRPAGSGQNPGMIWNRNHEVMYDMQGTQGGGFSAVQPGIAFADPGGDPNRHYLFTMEEREFDLGGSVPGQPLGRGLSYFVIDMSLNGGLGGVESADERVFTPAYEGLTAVAMNDDAGYWVIAHTDSANWVITPVTADGVGTPVTHPVTPGFELSGSIKATPDGRYLFCNQSLYPFNAANGTPDATPFFTFSSLNSLTAEFTPDGRYLFAAVNGGIGRRLVRFDLQAADIILEAAILFLFPATGFTYQMQLAPNGNLYFIDEDFDQGQLGLSEIRCPASPNPVFTRFLIPLDQTDDIFTGLPNYPPDIFARLASQEDTVFIANDSLTVCVNTPVELDPIYPGTDYSWSTGSTDSSIVVTAPGTYSVTITGGCQPAVESFTITNSPQLSGEIVLLSDTLTVCADQDSLQLTFISNQPVTGVLWSATDAGGNTVTSNLDTFLLPVQSGLNTVELRLNNDCEEVNLTFTTTPPVFSADLFEDFAAPLCPGDEVRLLIEGNFVEAVLWEDNSQDLTRLIEQADSSQIYVARVSSFCGDTLELTAELDYSNCPLVCDTAIPDLITPNGDGTNDLFKVYTNCPLRDFQLQVFNRWGQEVYSSTDGTTGWDGTTEGTPQSMDVYLYRLRFRYPDDAEFVERDGQFSLVR